MKETIRKSVQGVLCGILALMLCATVYSYWVETIETQWEAELVYPVAVTITGLPVSVPEEAALEGVEIEDHAVPMDSAPNGIEAPGGEESGTGETNPVQGAEPADASEEAGVTDDTQGQPPVETEPATQPQQTEPDSSTQSYSDPAEEKAEEPAQPEPHAQGQDPGEPGAQAQDAGDQTAGDLE